MACGVCSPFIFQPQSIPHRSTAAQKEKAAGTSLVDGFSGKVASRKAAMRLSNCNGLIHLGSAIGADWMIPCGHLYASFFGLLSMFPSVQIIIYGYWIGPDIEDDEWGFVEAVVDQRF